MNYQEIAKSYNLDESISKILIKRGFNTRKKLNDFFSPSIDKLQSYNDIPNIENVTGLLKEHIEQGSIVIFLRL